MENLINSKFFSNCNKIKIHSVMISKKVAFEIKKNTSMMLLLLFILMQMKQIIDVLNIHINPERVQLLVDLHFNIYHYYLFGLFSFFTAVFVIYPKTFFVGIFFNIAILLMIIYVAFIGENYYILTLHAVSLLISIALVWLKHPLANR